MKESFSCAAKCCINASSKSLNQCAEQCMRKMPVMQKIVQQEMQAFQERLQRCQMSCNDEARDRVSMADINKLSDSARDQLQQDVMKCANKCFVQYREKIPALYGRIEHQADRLSKEY